MSIIESKKVHREEHGWWIGERVRATYCGLVMDSNGDKYSMTDTREDVTCKNCLRGLRKN